MVEFSTVMQSLLRAALFAASVGGAYQVILHFHKRGALQAFSHLTLLIVLIALTGAIFVPVNVTISDLLVVLPQAPFRGAASIIARMLEGFIQLAALATGWQLLKPLAGK